MILDSNVIIYASNLNDAALLDFLKKNEPNIYVSDITKIEVLGYHQLKKVEKLFLENFFNAISSFPINNAILSKTIELRQKRPMSLGDAIIAATALVHQMPIISDDIKAYAKIKEIQCYTIAQITKNHP